MSLMADGRVQPPRERTGWKEWAALAAFLVVMTGGFFLFRELEAIQDTQAAGRERTFQSRAVTCDLNKAIGADEPALCQDPLLAEYRDPDLVAGSTASARGSAKVVELVCAVLAGASDPTVKQTHADLCLAE